MKSKQDIFLEYFEPIKDNVWRFCLNLSSSWDQAKDLLQETIEHTYRQFDDIKHKKALLSYMFTIAKRLTIARAAERSQFIPIHEVDYDSIISSDVPADKLTDIQMLYQCLALLPIEQRTALIMQEIMGFSQKEICKIEDITIAALKQRLHRGKARLTELMTDSFSNTNTQKCISTEGESHE